jgi:uncharacterized paraquat-inducible protein A
MFCKQCYANLNQASQAQCPRCGREFLMSDPSSYLRRPFPSRAKVFAHTLVMLVLATFVSLVVAGLLAIAQLKFIHSGH